jgi:murein DD-endopeptidase MepM/ murein hydrolase activator NlpD
MCLELGSKLLALALVPSILAGIGAAPALAGTSAESASAVDAGQAVDAPLASAADPRFGKLFGTWQQDDQGEPPAQITIDKAASGEGRPMYGLRDSFSQSASVVTFSTRRPPPERQRTAGAAGPPQVRNSGPAGPLPRFFPVSARSMTSGFGIRIHPILGVARGHSGVDLAVPSGTPIAATADGVVTFANWNGGYGLLVAVDHGGGVETRYGHMSRLAVAAGQQVRVGDTLGFVGSTGLSTGPHVHYEVRVNGQAVSPYRRN